MHLIPAFPTNSEDTLNDILKGFVVMSFILSGAGCLWRRRRRRQSNHSERHERRDDNSLRRAIAIAIEQRNREVHAGNRNVVQSPYRVPRAAPVDGKLDDVVIDMAEISFDDIELMKESKESAFHLKNKWLEQQLRLKHKLDAKSVKLEVDRNDLFYDSFRSFAKFSGEQLQGPLQIKFKREDGRDDGGLTRHWFMLISREVVNPAYALFTPVGKNRTFQVNSASKHQSHHLDYFRFIGRVWGKAIFDGFLVESNFASTIYKYLLERDIGFDDMSRVDPVYHSSLQWFLDNDIEAADLDLYFVIEEEEFGSIVQVPLKENGESIRVTNDNKHEYLELLCDRRLVKSVQPQLDSLKAGFYDIMPQDVLLKFTEDELELLLCGMPTIDIADWKENCEYKAGYTADHEVMLWFWELVESWDEEMRAKLLQFVTGTSRVPTGGFSGLYGATGPKRFQIIRVYDTTRLPQANTCFNELLLPPYDSKERLASCLAISLYDGGDVFGLR
mmetsp:Transcript_32559/g.103122  ORF Transcript_32559/g.103122 Transcript_32559/m.103122 type:complete len:502 (-) Transcript_32559:122-1627(-)